MIFGTIIHRPPQRPFVTVRLPLATRVSFALSPISDHQSQPDGSAIHILVILLYSLPSALLATVGFGAAQRLHSFQSARFGGPSCHPCEFRYFCDPISQGRWKKSPPFLLRCCVLLVRMCFEKINSRPLAIERRKSFRHY